MHSSGCNIHISYCVDVAGGCTVQVCHGWEQDELASRASFPGPEGGQRVVDEWVVSGGLVAKALDSLISGCELKTHQMQVGFPTSWTTPSILSYIYNGDPVLAGGGQDHRPCLIPFEASGTSVTSPDTSLPGLRGLSACSLHALLLNNLEGPQPNNRGRGFCPCCLAVPYPFALFSPILDVCVSL